MLRSAVITCMILAAGAARAEQTVPAGENASILLVALESSDAAVSRVLEAAAQALAATAKLRLLSPEQAGVTAAELQRCAEVDRLRCWSRSTPAGYLAVMSVRPGAEQAIEASILFIDVARARAIAEEPGAAAERIEEHIWARAAAHAEAALASAEEVELSRFLEHAFETTLRPLVERNGHWDALAIVDVEGAERGLLVELDGRPIAVTDGGRLRITGVRPGRRRLAVASQAGEVKRYALELQLVAGETRRVQPLFPAPPPSPRATDVVFYSGVGVAALGAGLVAAAFAAPARTTSLELCDGAPCGAEARTFTNFCELFSSDAQTCAPGGLRVAPLGLALVLTGGAWSFGSAVFERDDDWPWWSLAAGIVLGAVTYTAAAAAD